MSSTFAGGMPVASASSSARRRFGGMLAIRHSSVAASRSCRDIAGVSCGGRGVGRAPLQPHAVDVAELEHPDGAVDGDQGGIQGGEVEDGFVAAGKDDGDGVRGWFSGGEGLCRVHWYDIMVISSCQVGG